MSSATKAPGAEGPGDLKPGVWYRDGATVYRLKEVEGRGRHNWSAPGVRALENETLISVTGNDAEAIADQVLAALAQREATR